MPGYLNGYGSGMGREIHPVGNTNRELAVGGGKFGVHCHAACGHLDLLHSVKAPLNHGSDAFFPLGVCIEYRACGVIAWLACEHQFASAEGLRWDVFGGQVTACERRPGERPDANGRTYIAGGPGLTCALARIIREVVR